MFFSLPTLLLGAFYYWKITFDLFLKLELSWIFVILLLPFGAIPATFALYLHLREWRKYRKEMKECDQKES